MSACLFLCLVLPLHLSGRDFSSWEFTRDEQQAYRYIIALQMDKALPLLQADTPASVYLNNLRESITLIITEDPALADVYEDQVKQRLGILTSEQTQSPYKGFFIGEIHLQQAFVNLKLGNEWSAAWDLRRAYKWIHDNIIRYPDFLPHYKSMGLLHVIFGTVPERYQWLVSLLGLEGSVKKGLKELKKIAGSEHLFSCEALAVQHLLNAYLFNRTKIAVKNFKEIYDTHQDNKLFGYVYMSLLIKNAQSAAALDVFKHLQTLKADYLKFNFLNYLVGEIYLQKGDYAAAENHLGEFIKNNKGRNYIKDAYYKLFLVYWLKGHKTNAIKAHKKAQAAGQTVVGADKHAAKRLGQPQFPNKEIMKIRLLTDGGFYAQARKLMAQNHTFDSEKDQVEFIYRKARLYHKTGNITRAITHYMETIHAAADKQWYFAPNSCLALGYIFDERNDIARAKYYFNQVLQYKVHEYKASLDSKARIALAAYEQ